MRQKGFTLFEVTVTCLIVISTTGLGLKALIGVSDQHNLQAACQEVADDLARARIMAISANLPVTIKIRDDYKAYSVTEAGESLRWRPLPKGVAFTSVPKANVIFYSRGGAAPAGTYVITNVAGDARVVVSASGRVRWTRE